MADSQRMSVGWRAWVIRQGIARVTVLITTASTVASVAATTAISLAFFDGRDLQEGLISAVLVPILVAPPISYYMAGLVYELEKLRADLHLVAIRDGLTNAYNRRFFMSRLEVEVERARRTGQPVSVLMIDVDHFKSINDTHGHAVGDRVLEKLAQTLSATMRPYDLIARYGGEEFVALLLNTALPEAEEIAERVREAIQDIRISSAAAPQLAVTASIGVSELAAGDEKPTAMIERADQAMYRAKQGGRNRCVSLAADKPAA